MRPAALALAVLAAFPWVAAAQDVPEVGAPEVIDIAFSGNETFPTDSLRRAIVNRDSECRSFFLRPLCKLGLEFAIDRHYFDPVELPRDAVRLRLYYWQRGFRDAQVDTDTAFSEDDAVSLRFSIEEGQPVLIDSIAVLGGEALEDPTLLEGLALAEGDRLSGILIEATRDTLEARLHDSGYAYALVLLRTDLPAGSHAATVTFDVDPGPRARFGPIDIRGNRELSQDVVRRMLGFREGDLYSTSEILEAQRNLFGLEIVRYALVDTLRTSGMDTIIPLRVEITEGDEYRVRTGAGWSTAECVTTEARWTARNFFGGARRLQVRGRMSNILAESLYQSVCNDAGTGDYGRLNWLLAADFNQPWIFSPRNALSLGVYAERTSLNQIFVRKAVGLNVALTRSLGRATPLTLAYRPQLSRLEAAEVFFCTSFLACAPEDIDVLQGANWLAPVGIAFSSDQTDNLLNPRSGFRAAIDLEHASGWTGSNYAYNRAVAEGSWYLGVGGAVAASRLRVGWVGAGEFALGGGGALEVVHPQKRFFAGGSNSVRGYAQNRLGPKVLTVSVVELLQSRQGENGEDLSPVCAPADVVGLDCDATPLADGAFVPQPTGGTRVIEGNLEYRFPMTARTLEGVGFLDFGQIWGEGEKVALGELEWTPGLGIRYYSPIGPIRLDLGYRFSGSERLEVLTSQIRPFDPARDRDGDRIVVDEAPIPWVRVGELALLQPRVAFNASESFLSRLQLHFSIGQAF